MTMDIPQISLSVPLTYHNNEMNQFTNISSFDYRDVPNGLIDSTSNNDDLYGIQLFALNLRIIELNINRKLAYLKKIKDTSS
jgi:hypothetical protein